MKTLRILLFLPALLVTWAKFLKTVARQTWKLIWTLGLCDLTRLRAGHWAGELYLRFNREREGVSQMAKKCKGKKSRKMRR